MSQQTVESQQVSLNADEAYQLLRSGQDAWNQWVEANPCADIFLSFGYHSYYYCHNDVRDLTSFSSAKRIVDFNGYKFPQGKLKLEVVKDLNYRYFGFSFVGADLSLINLDLSGLVVENGINFSHCKLADGGHNFAGMQIKSGKL